MIKSTGNQSSFYNSNIRHIKVNKRSQNNSIKSNSPGLSHQENNYFYNTKINRLILQEAPNNNRIQNIYQQPGQYNKNIYIEYDFLQNNLNNMNIENKQINTLYKKNASFKKLPITVKKINENDVNNFYYNKDINGFNYVNINRNSHNFSQSSRDFYEANNNKNYNNNNYYNKYSGDEINNSNSFNINNNNNLNNDNLILSQRNKNYFYNIDNSINNNSINNNSIKFNNNPLQKSQIVNNNNSMNKIYNNNNNNIKSLNCKKIPIRQERIGNYYIRNPGMPDCMRNSSSLNDKNNAKNRYKSPEILFSKNKQKNANFTSFNNDIDNLDIDSKYKSGYSFYKKKEENNNKNNNANNNLYFIQKNNTSDNLNKKKKYQKNYKHISNNNLIIENTTLINPSNDIYPKIKFHKHNNSEISENNIERKELLNKLKDINLNEKKMNNINNFKNYIKNKLIDYNSMKKNIEEFCEILEQFYFISFKKSYKYFIEKLKEFNQNKNLNRAVILRRFNEGKKSNKLNNTKTNNGMTNISNDAKIPKNERAKTIDIETNNNKDIENSNKRKQKDKSPTKFVELQNNLVDSVMKINQDNYIKMFNDIFKKQNEEKRSCSPFIERSNRDKIENNSLKNSFDNNNNNISNEKVYNKYNTNTNVVLYFQKKTINKYNNLKINTDLVQQNRDTNLVMKKNVKTSLNNINTDNNNNLCNQNTIQANKGKNAYKIKKNLQKNNYKYRSNYNSNNNSNNINLNNIEYCNSNNIEYKINELNQYNKYDKTYFYDRNIFQNQNSKINNTIDQSLNNQNINNNVNSNNNVNKKESVDKKYKKINVNNGKKVLYSKPYIKKSKAKYLDQDVYNNKNMSVLDGRPYERNSNVWNNSSNNTLNRSLNYSKTPCNFEQKEYDEKDPKNVNNVYNNELIIKNVSTDDKLLHVFIKYIILEDYGIKNKDRLLSKLLNMDKKINYNFDQYKFINNHTDSISLISGKQIYKNISGDNNGTNGNENYEEEIYNKNHNILNKNKNNDKNNKDNYRYNEEEGDNINNIKNDKNIENKKINDNRYKLLTSIGEEEERSKNQFSLNNNVSEEDININQNNLNINEDMKNSTYYLISLLQNRYDDNKKSILYNFFKNLRRIKTNSILYSSVKYKRKKSLSISQNNIPKVINDKNHKDNIITDRNMNSNNNNYIKLTKKSKNKNDIKENEIINNGFNPNIKRNNKKYNLKGKLLKEDTDKQIYNNTQEVITEKTKNYMNISASFNRNNNMSFNLTSYCHKEDSIPKKKESLLGNIKKLKEEALKIRKLKSDNFDSNKDNIEDENNKELKGNDNEKEIIKQKKLAKLGKLFNNLNQENNIINAIKEQFLDWTNKNDLPMKPKFESNNRDEKNKYMNMNIKKEYAVKTFDIGYMINNKKNDYIKNENEKDKSIFNKEFERKIKVFRNKLIKYYLQSKYYKNKNEQKNKIRIIGNRAYKSNKYNSESKKGSNERNLYKSYDYDDENKSESEKTYSDNEKNINSFDKKRINKNKEKIQNRNNKKHESQKRYRDEEFEEEEQ